MRDMRPKENQKSIIDFDWLSPFTVGEILRGKKILENILKVSGDDVAEYHYHGMCIKASSLQKGLHYYDIALKLFMGRMLKLAKDNGFEGKPTWQTGLGRWNDLAGQLLPVWKSNGSPMISRKGIWKPSTTSTNASRRLASTTHDTNGHGPTG